MKTIFAILASFVIHQCVLAGFEAEIPLPNRVILKSGSWTPTADQAQKALASIQSFLSKPAVTNEYQLREIKKILANSKNYRVQFIGMIRDGRKIIWCNFFPTAGDGKDEFQYWRKERVQVEDGGFYYWKIEYDPATDECLRFYSNGYA
jgi:hypothetical protein